MAKKWGKRGRKQAAGSELDPRNMFGPPAPPRGAPPASSTPLADFLRRGWPGVDERYVVLPRTLAEAMPLPWQQLMVNQLAQFHDVHARLSWPAYRVVPSRPERLTDLDEEQLAEAGYIVEIDVDGEMVYRERNGRRVEDPGNTTVLVSCLDPVLKGADQAQAEQEQPAGSGPVPMNIGPEPVWHTTARARQQAPVPPLPPPPAAPAVAEPTAEAAAPETAGAADSAGAVETGDAPADPPTPPSGINLGRGWFDEPGEAGTADPAEAAEAETVEPAVDGTETGDNGEGPAEFGPTGDEPTEIPYRFKG